MDKVDTIFELFLYFLPYLILSSFSSKKKKEKKGKFEPLLLGLFSKWNYLLLYLISDSMI